MNKFIAIVLLALTALCFSPITSLFADEEEPAQEPVEPDETVALFNGEDLTGWTGNDNIWRIRNGIIHCTGSERGILRTDEHYTNYILTLEWRYPEDDASEGTRDSGVFLHAQNNTQFDPWPTCIEAQLQSGAAGDFWLMGIGVTPMSTGDQVTSGRIPRNDDVEEQPMGEWNTITITCDDGFIEIEINGEVANTGNHLTLTSGAIALQYEGQVVEFRNIEIGPLE